MMHADVYEMIAIPLGHSIFGKMIGGKMGPSGEWGWKKTSHNL